MKRCRLALVLALFAAAAAFPGDERTLPVDFIFLVDRSLSMKPVLEEVKRYLAGDVIGPLVVPGDSVTLLAFYGKVERIWQGRIGVEADKADLIRSLHRLAPDGRYTDIGRALDFLDPVLTELDAADRLKYILLLTDERQEAPPDSRYQSGDYTIAHRYLTYVNRRDFGPFRAITIGLGLDDRIAATAESLASFLRNPPERTDRPLPGSPESGAAGSGPGQGAAAPGSGADPDASGAPGAGPDARNAASAGGIPWILAGLGAGVAALAILVLVVRARAGKEERKKKPEEPGA
ncbi:MAG TPA: VWA domain-containing protein [Spirochaetia bacterium]|nr:VWA domain-containing protein [Spirochaetales bacterium]HRZ90486.1 VWA domain-containing protein [Spirochaetia bacterium]